MRTLLFSALVTFGLVIQPKAQTVDPFNTYTPIGISTNPFNPVNPQLSLPTGNLTSDLINYSLLLNHFDWMRIVLDNQGTESLDPLGIPVLFQNYPVDNHMMTHTFDPSLPYQKLVSTNDVSTLDMFWDNGWELLAMNLGYMPYSSTPITYANPFGDYPYIFLYNKQRGIIRCFANLYTDPAADGFDMVRAELVFANDEVSGLLRTNSTYDLALDHQTNTTAASTFATFPQNANMWFYVDFQVGYDPCTCLFNSEIEIRFHFTKYTELYMYSRTLNATFDLQGSNASGDPDPNFLAGVGEVSVQENFDNQAGLVIYQKWEDQLDEYWQEYYKILKENEEINAHNEGIKKKLAWLSALKVVMEVASTVAETIVIPEAEIPTLLIGIETSLTAADAAAISNTIINIGTGVTHESDGVHIDGAELLKKLPDIVGKGLDFYSEHLSEDLENNLSLPNRPIGSMGESTFHGVLNNSVDKSGIVLSNPGAFFPEVESASNISSFNYPIYNETLGLFALLNSPKVEMSKTIHTSPVSRVSSPQPMTFYQPEPPHTAYTIEIPSYLNTISNSNKFKFKLSDPLQYVINPAAGVDMSGVIIEAALKVEAITNEAPSTFYVNVPGFNLPGTTHLYIQRLDNLFEQEVSINNFESEDGFISSATTQSNTIEFETPFVQLGEFNNLVSEFELSSTQVWRDNVAHSIGTPDEPIYAPSHLELYTNYSTDADYPTEWLGNFYSTNSTFLTFFDAPTPTVELKLKVTMPFSQPNHHGGHNKTTQVFTYQVNDDGLHLIHVDTEIPSSFSITQNPNSISIFPEVSGSLTLSEELDFGNKIWNTEDLYAFGGAFAEGSIPNTAPSIRAYALDKIRINGNQSLENPIHAVSLTATNDIIVSGDVSITGNFDLRIDNFAGVTSTPNPPSTNNFVASFCQGQVIHPYLANTSRNLSASNNSKMEPLYKKEKSKPTELTLYPSPANDQLTIKAVGLDAIQKVDVINELGAVLMTLQSNSLSSSNNVNLNTHALDSGTYFLRCTYISGNVQVKTFVVMH